MQAFKSQTVLAGPQGGGGGQEPPDPSGSTLAPAGTPKAACIAPHPGGFARSQGGDRTA